MRSRSCSCRRAVFWIGTVCWGCWSLCCRRRWPRVFLCGCSAPSARTSWWISSRGHRRRWQRRRILRHDARIHRRRRRDSLGSGRWIGFCWLVLREALRRTHGEAIVWGVCTFLSVSLSLAWWFRPRMSWRVRSVPQRRMQHSEPVAHQPSPPWNPILRSPSCRWGIPWRCFAALPRHLGWVILEFCGVWFGRCRESSRWYGAVLGRPIFTSWQWASLLILGDRDTSNFSPSRMTLSKNELWFHWLFHHLHRGWILLYRQYIPRMALQIRRTLWVGLSRRQGSGHRW